MTNKTSERDAAIERWIVELQVPECAKETVRRKFKRAKLTTEEINSDRFAKITRAFRKDWNV